MNDHAVFSALEATHDEASFLQFAEALTAERRQVDALPDTVDGFRGEWANQSISHFLEAAHAWAKDSDFGLRPGPKSSNQWRLFAEFLYAGRGYE